MGGLFSFTSSCCRPWRIVIGGCCLGHPRTDGRALCGSHSRCIAPTPPESLAATWTQTQHGRWKKLLASGNSDSGNVLVGVPVEELQLVLNLASRADLASAVLLLCELVQLAMRLNQESTSKSEARYMAQPTAVERTVVNRSLEPSI